MGPGGKAGERSMHSLTCEQEHALASITHMVEMTGGFSTVEISKAALRDETKSNRREHTKAALVE